jgi:hypothetical protein
MLTAGSSSPMTTGRTITRRRLTGTARAAVVAGIVGVIANLLLVGFYAWQVGRPEHGSWLGPANDLVGSVGSALMAVVAFGLGPMLPQRFTARAANLVGIAAMVALTILGPLLVAGVLSFEVQSPIALGCFLVLAGWLVLVNRWLRGAIPGRVTRLGAWSGAAVLVGAGVLGLGFLLAVVRLPLYTVGGLLAVCGMLAIPIWFLLLGHKLPMVNVEPR